MCIEVSVFSFLSRISIKICCIVHGARSGRKKDNYFAVVVILGLPVNKKSTTGVDL